MPDKISRERKFDESLVEAIDETLTSMGAPIKNTVYFKLENSFNISKNEIPKRINEFTIFINRTFGLGASLFEIRCMQNLHSKIEVNIQVTEDHWSVSEWITKGMTFEKYIFSARKNYCSP
jgi:hypothetical protein